MIAALKSRATDVVRQTWYALFMRRVSFCLALAAALTAAVSAQAPKKHFMWAITQDGAPPTYLVGSLHVLTPQYYPLDAEFDKAFSASKVLIEEIDLEQMTNPDVAMSLMAKAMLTDGRTLDQLIDADLYKEVVARAGKAGIPAIAVQRMKPWMVALAITAPALKEAGFNADLGVDKYFLDKAKKNSAERRSLETIAYQLDRLDQMSLPLQQGMLKAVIADLDTQLDNVKTIADAWANGETSTLEKLLLGSFQETPELYERLIVERNRNWVAPVEQCVQQKTACFVVVGAAHLVGPDSLVALLKQKGYTVEQK
jgi:uncharacterized protein